MLCFKVSFGQGGTLPSDKTDTKWHEAGTGDYDESADLSAGAQFTTDPEIDATLRFLVSRGGQRTGMDFLEYLVRFVGDTLGVAYAFCGRLDSGESQEVETLAVYSHGEIVPNMSYALADTPCDNVIGKSMCCYVQDIQTLFPRDILLQEMEAESYVGTPLFTTDSEPLGIVVAIDKQPLKNLSKTKQILQLLSVTAAYELERIEADAKLKESEERFRGIADAASDWFWEMDENLRFIYLSDRVETATGAPPAFYMGKTREVSVVKIFGPVDRLIERRLWLTIVYVKRLAADGSSGGS